MADDRLPKKVLYDQDIEGHPKRGRPKHTTGWIDSLKQDCKYVNIREDQWVQRAKDRTFCLARLDLVPTFCKEEIG